MSKASVHRLGPLKYVHILDQITNVTSVVLGPLTIVCKQHEVIASGPHDMITIQPRHYVLIQNPVEKELDESGDAAVKFDTLGQASLRWGEREVRLSEDSPFPLYPGETLVQSETKLEMIYKNEALHLICLADFSDIDTVSSGIERKVGDEWLFEGPARYLPNINVRKLKKINATVIKQNQALRLRAMKDCIDRRGGDRVAGEEWLVKEIGAYLPGVYEHKIGVISARVLTDKKALHIRAIESFVDAETQIERKNGEQWLITNKTTETYIPSVSEEIAKFVKVTTLTSRQFCVIVNPWNESQKSNNWGAKKLVLGECSFFLRPGEEFLNGIENVYVLNEEQGLVLKCNEAFEDTIVLSDSAEDEEERKVQNVSRRPGDRWLIRGPMEFIPPIGAQVLRINNAISLGENEGIYVRDITTGVVRAVIGQTYLLNENEQLWEKVLPSEVEELLATDKGTIFLARDLRDHKFIAKMRQRMAARNKTRVVRYDVPHNHCVQVYDVKNNMDRVVFGPALVLLQPGEIISPLTLSGGKPKTSNALKCLHLRLGPEFSSDTILVETLDHCRLRVGLSYNWQFDVKDHNDDAENSKLFAVEDFIGDMCKSVSSRVRSAVSGVAFDQFHTTSAKLIRSCVFGVSESGKVRDEFYFAANNLKLTGIDIRSIEPEDRRTRDALQRSVQLAIEISAQAQEAMAKAAQKQLEQEARGKLQKQRLIDESEAEVAQKKFFQVQAETKAVQQTGKARAQARSKAEMLKITAQQAVDEAQLSAEAENIKAGAELDDIQRRHVLELDHLRKKNELAVLSARTKAEIECQKFEAMCQAIGSEAILHISQAGPELKQRIMKQLGFQASVISSAVPFVDV